jgi:hypothetical protein
MGVFEIPNSFRRERESQCQPPCKSTATDVFHISHDRALACWVSDYWFSAIAWILAANASYLLYAFNGEFTHRAWVNIALMIYASTALLLTTLVTLFGTKPDAWSPQGKHDWRICIGLLSAFTGISCAISKRQWSTDSDANVHSKPRWSTDPDANVHSNTKFQYHIRDAYLPGLVNIPTTVLFILNRQPRYIPIVYCVIYCVATLSWYIYAWFRSVHGTGRQTDRKTTRDVADQINLAQVLEIVLFYIHTHQTLEAPTIASSDRASRRTRTDQVLLFVVAIRVSWTPPGLSPLSICFLFCRDRISSYTSFDLKRTSVMVDIAFITLLEALTLLSNTKTNQAISSGHAVWLTSFS